MTEKAAEHDHEIHYSVDGEPQSTTERVLTPRKILVAAGLNPVERYLVLVEGKHQESFQGKLDVEIHMHEKMVFVTVYIGTVPVS